LEGLLIVPFNWTCCKGPWKFKLLDTGWRPGIIKSLNFKFALRGFSLSESYSSDRLRFWNSGRLSAGK